MKVLTQFVTISLLTCILLSCGVQPSGENHLVREKMSIMAQSGKPVTVEMHALSGNGPNDVGIRCSPEVWNELTNGTTTITVRLNSSDRSTTKIYGVNPGGTPAGFLYRIPDVHYLFEISGEYRSKASVEIIFPNAPTNGLPVEIIVCNTPADTGM